MARRLSPEGLALFVICTLDALSTYLFLVLGIAREANPILRTAVYGDRAVVVPGDCHEQIDRIIEKIPK